MTSSRSELRIERDPARAGIGWILLALLVGAVIASVPLEAKLGSEARLVIQVVCTVALVSAAASTASRAATAGLVVPLRRELVVRRSQGDASGYRELPPGVQVVVDGVAQAASDVLGVEHRRSAPVRRALATFPLLLAFADRVVIVAESTSESEGRRLANLLCRALGRDPIRWAPRDVSLASDRLGWWGGLTVFLCLAAVTGPIAAIFLEPPRGAWLGAGIPLAASGLIRVIIPIGARPHLRGHLWRDLRPR